MLGLMTTKVGLFPQVSTKPAKLGAECGICQIKKSHLSMASTLGLL